MKQKNHALALAAVLLLTGCGGAASNSIAASEVSPESTVTPAEEKTDSRQTDDTAQDNTAKSEYRIIELAQWTAQMSGRTADYTIEGPHEASVKNDDTVDLPEEGIVLQALWWGKNGTLEDAAKTYGMTLEELQYLNPDISDADLLDESGQEYYYADLLLQEELYRLPETQTQTVTITTSWVQNRYDVKCSYEVPAALDEQAAAAMAEAYTFLRHYNVSLGYYPNEELEGMENESLYRASEGARFTNYTDFSAYLNAVFTPELAEVYATGGQYDEDSARHKSGFFQGDNDALCFTAGERGTNILYCGTIFTEPELQKDGSLNFWQLSLQADKDTFEGWGREEPMLVAVAKATPVRLVSTENGWRVAQLELPY